MKVRLRIHYQTSWGQKLIVRGAIPVSGNQLSGDTTEMTHQSGDIWTLEFDIPDKKTILSYTYGVAQDGYTDWEWGAPRTLEVNPNNQKSVLVWDSWRTKGLESHAWMTAAFTDVLMKRKSTLKPHRSLPKATLRLQVDAPLVPQSQVLCVLGDDPALGDWNESEAVVMDGSQFPIWSAELERKEPNKPLTYKYAFYDPETQQVTTWEKGENRYLEPAIQENELLVKNEEPFRQPHGWRGAGVAMPVFSLRSKNGFGVGELPDIKLLVDWAVQTEMKLVQILPINDTIATHTWTDSYPYSAISVFALHPIYLNLETMGKLKSAAKRATFKKEQKRLNALPVMDFETVMKAKAEYIKLLYDQEREVFLKDKGFQTFFKENEDWLVPYAAFCALRDRNGTVDFATWKKHGVYDAAAIKRLVAKNKKDHDDFAIHYFSQYHLHLQMADAATYARDKGVVLKGDIPIGICRNSVDAWVLPHLFNMDAQAGAPPDAFAVVGQNWEFPTYNWAEMAKDGYTWWRNRLTQMATYFDAYRIDHILGFFRIWEIPLHAVQGLQGYFNPALPMSRVEVEGWLGGFDKDRFCRPYIREHMLGDFFGEYTGEAKANYLEEYYPGHFRLKPHVDTQRKIESQPEFWDNENPGGKRIMQGLMGLTNEVLFLEDPHSEGESYNPRIAFQQTRSFKDLDQGFQTRLNELYTHYFYHRHEEFWRAQAMTKLPAIVEATNMLVCGEDLGMVPACVPGVMDELGLLSLEIQRMPKDNRNGEFGRPEAAPYLSVVSPSSHDMSTIRGWWEEDRGTTQRFYSQVLGHYGSAPEFCEPWISEEITNQHLYSPAMWAIFPIQDLIGIDGILRQPYPEVERINDPSNANHYWQYRIHVSLEDLLKERSFNEKVKGMVVRSGR